jgi:phage terminase large subunit-like protein
MATDLCTVSLVFPAEDGDYDVLVFFWMPEPAVRRRQRHDGMPYQRWAEQGFIELSAGEVIDFRDITARLEWAAEMFDLQQIGVDPSNSRQILVPLVEQGHDCREIRQNVATLSEPSKTLLELVATGKLHHGGHPVLRWNASCVTAKEQNDNLMFNKPERSKDSSRIDGIAATVNALACALVSGPRQMSINCKHGLLFL